MAFTVEEIMSDLKNRIFKPVYFLAGEEPYFIDLITDYIEENVLQPDERSFNQTILYGEDTDIRSVIEISRRFPMMSTHQVVIVKEAQSLKKIEELEYYLQSPLASTILVINYKYKKLDKRTKFSKMLDSVAVYLESSRLYDYQVPAWIEKYLQVKGLRIKPDASQMLTEYLGTDLHKIANELNKLVIALEGTGKEITPATIEENIGISKDYNNFELQKAIGARNLTKANQIILYMGENQKEVPFPVTIATLFSYFVKILTYHYTPDKSKNNIASVLRIRPFFVTEYESAARRYSPDRCVYVIGLLRQYDLKSKGFGDISSSPGDLLKELIFKIMH